MIEILVAFLRMNVECSSLKVVRFVVLRPSKQLSHIGTLICQFFCLFLQALNVLMTMQYTDVPTTNVFLEIVFVMAEMIVGMEATKIVEPNVVSISE
ncbi:MAG: hypothetical protein AB2693_26380 [Candidatus Thiodiazotropha sp.]